MYEIYEFLGLGSWHCLVLGLNPPGLEKMCHNVTHLAQPLWDRWEKAASPL